MKDLKSYIIEMAHAHKELRTRPIMTPWGEYTGDIEDYEEYVVDKCDQQDWADFLRGKDELGDNLQKMKFYKIEKTKEFKYCLGDERDDWEDNKFETIAIRWKEDEYRDKDQKWNIEMYAGDGCNLALAEELFKDIEAYRTNKMSKDEFVGKWDVKYNDPKSKSDFSALEMNITKKENNKKIKVHMNAILS